MPQNKNKQNLTANDLLGKFAYDKAVTYYTRKNLLYYSKEKNTQQENLQRISTDNCKKQKVKKEKKIHMTKKL